MLGGEEKQTLIGSEKNVQHIKATGLLNMRSLYILRASFLLGLSLNST